VTHSTPSPPDPEIVAALPHVVIDRSPRQSRLRRLEAAAESPVASPPSPSAPGAAGPRSPWGRSPPRRPRPRA
jgi:hypothetical protein